MHIRILTPYSFTKEEDNVIHGNFSTYRDWPKVVFDKIKENIIIHLRKEQRNKCCYCNRELGFDIKSVEIEHIIPKSLYGQFTFTPRNLALSCPGCNNGKGAENILKRSIIIYPRTSSNIKIIHPHYDCYQKHIEIHDGTIYEGLDAKGCETIKVCKIFRLKNVVEMQKKMDIAKGSIIGQLVHGLQSLTPEQRLDVETMLKMVITTNQ